jgi:peptide deformylase
VAEIDEETLARREAAFEHIVQWGDPVLRSRARPVEVFDDALARQATQMIELMDEAIGAGLAAPQVGLPIRMFVYRADADEEARALVNPQIEWRSEETEVETEACLSIQRAAIAVDVERAVRVRVRARDVTGAEVVVEAEGHHARILQHELDHLDGVLMLDRTTKDQRREAMRALRA